MDVQSIKDCMVSDWDPISYSEPAIFLVKERRALSSWEISLSMRQISLREHVEIAWFTRDI